MNRGGRRKERLPPRLIWVQWLGMTWRSAPFSAIDRPSFGRSGIGLRKIIRVVVENWLTVRG